MTAPTAKTKISCALYQMNAGQSPSENAALIVKAAKEAAAQGVQYLFTPENSNFMRDGLEYGLEQAESDEKYPFLTVMRETARENEINLLIGSVKYRKGDKLRNRSLLIDKSGKTVAYYDKIHLFDVNLSETEYYKESDVIEPGEHDMTAYTDDFILGFSVCYDLRFPYLFSKLALRGAQVITVPAAFTVPTGRSHWHVLLRARAIETGCFIIAPGQVGEHHGGRKTYGHSLVVNPNGEIIAEAKRDAPELIPFTLDLSEVSEARRKIPCLEHYRFDL